MDLIDPQLRPLLSPRPRRLTSTQDAYNQFQSTLVARLPPEIRVLIWAHVIGRENDQDVLHLNLADGILRYNRCYEPESELPVFQHSCWGASWRKSFRVGGLRGNGEPIGHRYAILPLLFTCKLFYTESVDLLYSSKTFDFRRTDSVIRLPSIMLPYRIQQLRHIQFSTAFSCYDRPKLPPGLPADFWKLPDDRRQWPAACEVLASLQHLQYVWITVIPMCQLARHRHPVDVALLNEILQPLKAVHAAEFTVEISEPLELVRERLGTTPFHLVERKKPKPLY